MIEGKSLRSDLHRLARALTALHHAMPDPEARRKLGILMADLDECLDDEEALAVDMERRFHIEVERLLGPLPPADPAFRERYTAMLAASPAVAIADAALRVVLARMPVPPQP
ncbi:hypothetical protein [Pseudoduganella namucuonensis]|uniref:DUF4404 family protein n=1 Tax=Pseudoduganella namucuonensis TaxID=1035707 RepID=A0A1I7KNB5_9BURK|nr:hypothetical protein [Pseudoduganella namucuonensis]SFU98911.1 hypothetical protein SAMN05216552_101846 [Pseudoduganella namucuonensis]